MQAGQGLEAQFIVAVREHREAMFRLARSMLRNDWDAEDTVSDAMERAWGAIRTLRDWQRVRPWLLRITYRCGLAALKKRSQETPQEPGVLQALAGPAHEEIPLWMYLEALPHKGRVVMHLRYAEGLPLQEIAAVLRLPKGTVSARISRATRQLREMMVQEEQAHG